MISERASRDYGRKMRLPARLRGVGGQLTVLVCRLIRMGLGFASPQAALCTTEVAVNQLRSQLRMPSPRIKLFPVDTEDATRLPVGEVSNWTGRALAAAANGSLTTLLRWRGA